MKRAEVEKTVEDKMGAMFAHYFGLIQETFNERMNAFQEGLTALRQDMNRGFAEVHARLSTLETDVGILKMDVATINERVERLEENQTTKRLAHFK